MKAIHIDAVTALKKVSSTLVLPISADAATAVPASDIEHYVLKGSSGAHPDPKAHLVYFQAADNTLSLSWRVETDIVDNWLQTYIDAKSGSNILGVIDYVSDASYTVL
jgi:extracellular elastinolytic metalloproteinase